ncbi:pathogenesis-related thaumatin-like protein 3.5 [Malania oleifera]|uniref:pathogenesis-related thaumatin-like protein 3.5 n=1 Tax=Malania oleifera TaxID=397392 RepID=UPI0025ADE6E0|nr:pathogenesis-related thaumatin-like protein 3.5 [Malania oleifera]
MLTKRSGTNGFIARVRSAPSFAWIFPTFFLFLISFFSSGSLSCTFTITNNCPHTIWPGTLAGSSSAQLLTTGFRLDSGQTIRIPTVPGWSGRIWGRTGCVFNELGVGTCQTGDCGGRLECDGNGATPPASLFEITLGRGNDKDFYDVSIVDGYNLPLVAAPYGVFGGCNATGCTSNINMGCPKELQVVGGGGEGEREGVVACRSACEAFGLDQYCCSGEFANPTTCRPTFYSSIFKRACPRAYSYAFDDGTSTFTCKAYDYDIIFCPDVNGMKRSNSGFTFSSIQESSNAETRRMVSSAFIFLAFSMSTLLILNIQL